MVIVLYMSILSIQHFQLIMQTFVLARFEPSLVFVSQVAAQALVQWYMYSTCQFLFYMYMYIQIQD